MPNWFFLRFLRFLQFFQGIWCGAMPGPSRVCFGLLHDTNLGPTIPACSLPERICHMILCTFICISICISSCDYERLHLIAACLRSNGGFHGRHRLLRNVMGLQFVWIVYPWRGGKLKEVKKVEKAEKVQNVLLRWKSNIFWFNIDPACGSGDHFLIESELKL